MCWCLCVWVNGGRPQIVATTTESVSHQCAKSAPLWYSSHFTQRTPPLYRLARYTFCTEVGRWLGRGVGAHTHTDTHTHKQTNAHTHTHTHTHWVRVCESGRGRAGKRERERGRGGSSKSEQKARTTPTAVGLCTACNRTASGAWFNQPVRSSSEISVCPKRQRITINHGVGRATECSN